MHRRRHRTNHPTITVATTHFAAYGFRLGAVPQFIPRLPVQVAHHLLVFRPVARHHVAIRVYEERVETHVARQQALLPVDVIDKAMVEISTEPLLGRIRLQQFIDQVLKILRYHRTVMDDVLGLHEIERVVQGSRGKLHPHFIGKLI